MIKQRNYFLFFLLVSALGAHCQDIKKEMPLSFTVTVFNPLKTGRENEMIIIPASTIDKQIPDFNPKAFAVMDGNVEIPSQYNFRDQFNRGMAVMLPNLQGGETRKLTVRYKKDGAVVRHYAKMTQAEISHKSEGEWRNREYIGGTFHNVNYLRVPPEHKDHSWFIRYEGPGWESDKVAYRLYLDQRNATDVFGKKTPDMILQQVGLDGFDSYHEMQTWGMDVMKVGPSLGLGSIGAWDKGKVTRVEKTDSVSCRILENGDIYSSFVVNYNGWRIGERKINVQAHFGIHGGSRVTIQTLYLSNDYDSLCTGIVKDQAAPVFSRKGDKQQLGYIATYGKQSLHQDELGLAVMFKPENAVALTEDSKSHIVTLKSEQRKLVYYFLASWILEPGGIVEQENFEKYLALVAQQLSNPIQYTVHK